VGQWRGEQRVMASWEKGHELAERCGKEWGWRHYLLHLVVGIVAVVNQVKSGGGVLGCQQIIL